MMVRNKQDARAQHKAFRGCRDEAQTVQRVRYGEGRVNWCRPDRCAAVQRDMLGQIERLEATRLRVLGQAHKVLRHQAVMARVINDPELHGSHRSPGLAYRW
jgi:hypothetical protein